MKIQSSVHFGKKDLYSVKLDCPSLLFGVTKKDFVVSELDTSDKVLLEKNFKKWKDTYVGEKIINNFLSECNSETPEIGRNKRFFIVEKVNRVCKNQIKALCLAELIKSNVYISYLQAEREFSDKKRIHGLGSSMMYAIINLAKKSEKNSVTLISSNKATGFYSNLGLIRLDPFAYHFYLSKKCFDEVLNTVKNKYLISELK